MNHDIISSGVIDGAGALAVQDPMWAHAHVVPGEHMEDSQLIPIPCLLTSGCVAGQQMWLREGGALWFDCPCLPRFVVSPVGGSRGLQKQPMTEHQVATEESQLVVTPHLCHSWVYSGPHGRRQTLLLLVLGCVGKQTAAPAENEDDFLIYKTNIL